MYHMRTSSLDSSGLTKPLVDQAGTKNPPLSGTQGTDSSDGGEWQSSHSSDCFGDSPDLPEENLVPKGKLMLSDYFHLSL